MLQARLAPQPQPRRRATVVHPSTVGWAGRTTERTTGGTHMHKAASTLFADESADLHQEVARIVANPEVWLHTSNTHLGGESPLHLIGTPQEQRLRDLLRAIKHGMLL